MNGNLYQMYKAERFEHDHKAEQRRLADVARAQRTLVRTTVLSSLLVLVSLFGMVAYFVFV